MTTRTGITRSNIGSTIPKLESIIRDQLSPIVSILAKDPKRLEDESFMKQAYVMVERTCGNDEIAKLTILRQLIVCQKQRDELLAVLKSLREQKPTLAWILSHEFEINGTDRPKRYVFAAPLGRVSLVSECFQVVERLNLDVDAESSQATSSEVDIETPDPPFLGVIEPANRLFLGPASHIPPPPLRSEMFQVVSSYSLTKFENLAEIEVTDGTQEKTFTVLSGIDLAKKVRHKMDEGGETVNIRVESGVATGIHKSDQQKHEDWLEFPSLDGPSVTDLIFPAMLRKEWERDIRNIALGRAIRVVLIGPTGTGKTSAVERIGRDAVKYKRHKGKHKKGFALIRISSSHIGSSFIHQTERNMFRALKRAEGLGKQGYIVVVLCDEADALLGEMDGTEHSHNRSERLMAQSLLTNPMDNVAVYLTMNQHRKSWLPSAIDRRFLKRVYGRAPRSLIEAVATYYISQHPKELKMLRMSETEFAGTLSDNLYSDRREVALIHYYSGRTIKVLARDLHNCSPGKVKDLIDRFCCDVIDGITDSIESLWIMLDQEFRAPNINARNLHELTFVPESHDDTIRHVELV
jgi:hypothetical protein